LPSTVPHLQASTLFSSVASVINLMAVYPLSVRIPVPFNSSTKSLDQLFNRQRISGRSGDNLFHALMSAALGYRRIFITVFQ